MSNKTQLSTNNDKLASLIQELANKAAGGGSGGSVFETGTLTGATTYGFGGGEETYYYYDLTQFDDKTMVVLSENNTACVVLVKNNTTGEFENVANISNGALSISVFDTNVVRSLMSQLIYYAA